MQYVQVGGVSGFLTCPRWQEVCAYSKPTVTVSTASSARKVAVSFANSASSPFVWWKGCLEDALGVDKRIS